jgi:hypothetical protein
MMQRGGTVEMVVSACVVVFKDGTCGRRDGISVVEKRKGEVWYFWGEQALAEVRRCLAFTVVMLVTFLVAPGAWGGDDGGRSQCGSRGRCVEEGREG